MKQQELFKKIGNIVKEINEQYEYLQQAGDLFNDLELELMAANAHFLSDHIEILRKIKISDDSKPAAALPKPSLEGMATENFKLSFPGGDLERAQPAKTQEWFTPETRQKASTESIKPPEPETIRYELTIDDTGEDWDEDEAAEETYIKPEPIAATIIKPEVITPEPVVPKIVPDLFVPKPEPIPEKIIEPEVVFPKAAPVQPMAPLPIQATVEEKQILTFNQRIAASRATEPPNPQPVSDLKSAINLNDKLLYIKDLFNGYSLAYSEALDILNRFRSFEEADSFLKSSYALKNNWADKEVTSDKFYALLRRRYL